MMFYASSSLSVDRLSEPLTYPPRPTPAPPDANAEEHSNLCFEQVLRDNGLLINDAQFGASNSQSPDFFRRQVTAWDKFEEATAQVGMG